MKPLFPLNDGKLKFVRVHSKSWGFPPVLQWCSQDNKNGYLTRESYSKDPGAFSPWSVTYSGYIK